MGEKGNPLEFVGELPSSVISSLPDIAKAYREWREKQEAEPEVPPAETGPGPV